MPKTSTSYRPGQLAPGQLAGVLARQRIQRLRVGLASGEITVEDVLNGDVEADLVPQAPRLQLGRVLAWMHGLGPRSCDRILDAVNLAPATRVGEIKPADRRKVVAAIAAFGPSGTPSNRDQVKPIMAAGMGEVQAGRVAVLFDGTVTHWSGISGQTGSALLRRGLAEHGPHEATTTRGTWVRLVLTEPGIVALADHKRRYLA